MPTRCERDIVNEIMAGRGARPVPAVSARRRDGLERVEGPSWASPPSVDARSCDGRARVTRGVADGNWSTVRSNDLSLSPCLSLSLIRSSSGRWRRAANGRRTNRVTAARQGGDNRSNDGRRDNRITADAAATSAVPGTRKTSVR